MNTRLFSYMAIFLSLILAESVTAQKIFSDGFEDGILIIDIPFDDLALEDCVEQYATQQGWIWASEVEHLSCVDQGIGSLSGLEYLIKLISLNLQNNLITNLTPLQSLNKLMHIELTNNLISDLSALAGLTQLNSLGAGENQIQNIPLFANLTNLGALSLEHNEITDLTPLQPLNNLQHFDVSYNLVSDVSALSTKTTLDTLTLIGNYLTDVSSLYGLTQLTWLGLELQNPPGLDCSQQQGIVLTLPSTNVGVDGFWNDPNDDPDEGNIDCFP